MADLQNVQATGLRAERVRQPLRNGLRAPLWAPLLLRLLAPLMAGVLACSAVTGHAKEAPAAVEDPVLEKRTLAIAAELRCLVCQNQTIADSNAGLAVDLRDQVRQMLREGKTEKQILDFMTQRYGDFVLYRPPVKGTTALLWFGPPALLLAGALTLWLVLRKRSRMAADEFEPDEADDQPSPDTSRPGSPGTRFTANP